MASWQQLLATVLVALIAPVALYLQQRQQNARDLAREQIEAGERQDQAATQRVTDERAGRRGAYLAVLRAANTYRGEVAGIMASLRDSACAGEGAESTADHWGVSNMGAKSRKSFARAHEAIAEAALWATTPATLAALNGLAGALDAVEDAAGWSKNRTVSDAAATWDELNWALATFGQAARSELE